MNRFPVAVIALLLCAGRSQAQRAYPLPSHDDSLIVRAVTEATLAELTPELAEVIRGNGNQSWAFSVPQGTEWARTERGLRQLLQARVPSGQDTVQYSLSISRAARTDSTALYHVEIARREHARCSKDPRVWLETSREFDILGTREQNGWWQARRDGLVVVGDPAPC
jgi:hypothetical protein